MWPFDKLTTGIVSQEIAKRLNGDDGAGNGIIFGNRLLEKDLQGFPGTAAQACPREGGDRQEASCSRIKYGTGSEEISAQDLRDAEDKMAMGNLLKYKPKIFV
jgi:hypothetical protein